MSNADIRGFVKVNLRIVNLDHLEPYVILTDLDGAVVYRGETVYATPTRGTYDRTRAIEQAVERAITHATQTKLIIVSRSVGV